MALVYLASWELYHPTSKQAHILGRLLSTTFNIIKVKSHFYPLSAKVTNTKSKIKRLFSWNEWGEGRGAYRIYELEGQTLGFRKIYDWLNKLKQTTSHTQEEIQISIWGLGWGQLKKHVCDCWQTSVLLVRRDQVDLSVQLWKVILRMNCLILESTAMASVTSWSVWFWKVASTNDSGQRRCTPSVYPLHQFGQFFCGISTSIFINLVNYVYFEKW